MLQLYCGATVEQSAW